MATKLTASAVATYNNGTYYSDDAPVVGYRSAGVPRVIRYTFTTPSTSSSSYSVMISGCSKLDGDCTSLKCFLTTSDSSHALANSTYASDATLTRRASTTGSGEYEFYSGEISKSLSPNTTYYLWVFASSTAVPLSVYLPKSGYQFQTSLATITVDQSSGIVYIDNGSGFEAYQVFIDNGSTWEQYIPYIDNGTSWEQYG